MIIDSNNQPLQNEQPLLFKGVGTIALTVGGVISYLLLQIMTLFLAFKVTNIFYPEKFNDINNPVIFLQTDGTLLAISFVFNLLFILVMTATLIKLRRFSVLDYLAIRWFKKKIAFIALFSLALYIACIEYLFTVFERQPMDFLAPYYESAQPLWLLILAIVILAPIYEEVVFRGILWKVIVDYFNQCTHFGTLINKLAWLIGSIVTGLVFAVIHMQYELFEMSSIFVLALLFGYVRYRSNSLLLPIALHIINNGLAMVQYVLLN